jgi:hypothetical protein
MGRNIRFHLWIFVVCGMPSVAYAHANWFVDADHVPPDPSLTYRLIDPAVQLWMGLLAVGLILAYMVDRLAPQPPQVLIKKGEAWRKSIIYIFQLIIGVALITTAYRGAILAPHLKAGADLGLVLRGLESVVGLLFILNLWVRMGAFILFVLYIAIAGIFGLLSSLEYCNFLGIALFLIFIKSPRGSRLGDYSDWAVPLLRLSTGVALSVLAFSEKLLQPSLAMHFLAEHPVNFMKALGIEGFSDHLFVLSAGFCELLFGLIFISGLVTRINTIAIAFFLLASNLYFFLVGDTAVGLMELIGHSNLLCIAMVLVFYGVESRVCHRMPGYDGGVFKKHLEANDATGPAGTPVAI